MKKRHIVAAVLTLAILIATYKFWLIFKSAHSAHFDFYPFVIILVLSYLGTLKLTDYLADFKDIKHQSRIEIVFLLVFFILLFIPMSHINQDVKSKKENRRLAVYKPLFKKHQKINYNFGRDFDAWYNDRFNLRYPLFCFYNNIIMKINPILVTNKGLFNQKTNWMFSRGQLIVYDKFSALNMNNDIIVPFETFESFCKMHNIKLYVILVPFTPQLYPEEVAPFYSQKDVDKLNTYLQSIQNKTNVNIIYPYNELVIAKQSDYVYFKTEHHWTESGAYIGYQKLMSEIQKDFPKIRVVQNDDYNIIYSKKVRGDWSRAFTSGWVMQQNFPFLEKNKDKILDTEYKYYEHKNSKLLKTTVVDIPKHKYKEYYYPYGADLRVLQMGTSMNENLTQFTPYTFKNLKYIRLNTVKELKGPEEFKIMKYYKHAIIDYKPDIMILCITIGNLGAVKHIFEEAE